MVSAFGISFYNRWEISKIVGIPECFLSPTEAGDAAFTPEGNIPVSGLLLIIWSCILNWKFTTLLWLLEGEINSSLFIDIFGCCYRATRSLPPDISLLIISFWSLYLKIDSNDSCRRLSGLIALLISLN